MIYFTSDTHFGHNNILKYCPDRKLKFGDVDMMNQKFIDNWNDTISPDDDVYFLGDFMMSPYTPKIFLDKLNGNVILIAGNHDPVSEPYHSQKYLSAFDKIYDELYITHEEYNIKLSHEPANFLNDECGIYDFGLCGHVHQNWKNKNIGNKIYLFEEKKSFPINNVLINVGVDVWDYYPVSIHDLINFYEDYKNGSDQKEN